MINNMQSEIQNKPRANSHLHLIPYTKEFSYAVPLSTEDCLARLNNLVRPRIGFFNPNSRTIMMDHEVNHVRFEIYAERYSRGFIYASAIAEGIVIAAAEHPEIRVIKGHVRLGKMIWLYIFALGILTFVSASTGDLAFSLLALILCLVFVRRDYNDYRQLYKVIQDTFSQDQHVT